MAYNEQLARRINETLSELHVQFEEKKMFGGIAFMIKNKMCCGIVNDDLMVRVMEDQYETLLEEPHASEMNFTGRVMKGFIMVEPEGLKSTKQLTKWIQHGIEFGKRGVVKSKKKK